MIFILIFRFYTIDYVIRFVFEFSNLSLSQATETVLGLLEWDGALDVVYLQSRSTVLASCVNMIAGTDPGVQV